MESVHIKRLKDSEDFPEYFDRSHYALFEVDGLHENLWQEAASPLSSANSADGGFVLDRKMYERWTRGGKLPRDSRIRELLLNDGFQLVEAMGSVSTWAVPYELVSIFPIVMRLLAKDGQSEIPWYVRNWLFEHYQGSRDYHDNLAEELPELANQFPHIFKAPTQGKAYRYMHRVELSQMHTLLGLTKDDLRKRKGIVLGGMYEPQAGLTSWSASYAAVMRCANFFRGVGQKGSNTSCDILLEADLSHGQFYLNPKVAPYVCGTGDIKGVDIVGQYEVVSTGLVPLVRSVWQLDGVGKPALSSEQEKYTLDKTPLTRLRSLLRKR